MKACVLEEVGKIKYKNDVATPEVKAGELLVRAKAAGICGSDIARVYTTGAHKMPLIIGHEFSGVVEATGKKVGIFPLIPCRKCPACLTKKYEMCSNYNYLGSRTDGGFAEYVAVPKWNIIELPDNVTFEQAAMLEPMAVAVHAMRQLNVEEDSTVVVCGLGTIGQLLIMFLKEKGINNIYAIGNKEKQREAVALLGLPEANFFNSKNDGNLCEWISDKTAGQGADAYYECVGTSQTVAQGPDIVKQGGQICLVGNPASDIAYEKNIYWKILRKQLTLKGTWNSSFYGQDDPEASKDDWNYVINLLNENKIYPEKLITHRFTLEDLEKGLVIMRDKSEFYTKIMINV